MFERVTPDAKRVLVLAQEEARKLFHNYMGTEHLLQGLVVLESGASRALAAHGITKELADAKIEKIIGHGQQSPSGEIPFTPRLKKVLEFALRESLQLNQSVIGPEILLLALIREGEGVAARVLVKLGVDLNKLRNTTLELMGQEYLAANAQPPAEPKYVRGTVQIRLPHLGAHPSIDSPQRAEWVTDRIDVLQATLRECARAAEVIEALKDTVNAELDALNAELGVPPSDD